ncbi:MAG: hypothetical protein A3J48_01400 [Candidatus Doudnabacteria bacterium RIFCSPHIGHO2_02_FULL_46_11]|uniref:Uncharacterized protein n=1 Tax=Candidatus Doudnabacteria bacterium RIFCSPHIGHO2_02_FULL_46_11 TaxID=1817832 RepID=A0A1F5P4C8_9BACT|nr:MAG: hypothetical protein A3J48_01400 [Candidatus Doudnabacteria bacterium RIFCSPHIGHO2_02_FULL_46_11]
MPCTCTPAAHAAIAADLDNLRYRILFEDEPCERLPELDGLHAGIARIVHRRVGSRAWRTHALKVRYAVNLHLDRASGRDLNGCFDALIAHLQPQNEGTDASTRRRRRKVA